MKLTKLGHACFIVEEQGQKLIVDPGAFSELPQDISHAAAVVITHDHGDHFSPENLDKIRDENPEVQIFAAREVAAKLPGSTEPALAHAYQAGPFSLRFYGGLHETIRPGLPPLSNLGICINDTIAYPGDSYAQAGKRVKIIMAPVSAPWLHVSAAYAFVSNAQADTVIPTHDALLSETGQQIYDAHLREAAETAGSTYRRLQTGESIEV